MPVCFGVGLVFGSGAVARYKSIIKLQFYLLFSEHRVFWERRCSNCGFVKSTLVFFRYQILGFCAEFANRLTRGATVGVAPPPSVFPPASCGGAPKSWHLRICCKPKTSRFTPSFPSHLNTKTNTAPPRWLEGRSWGTPTVQLAALSEQAKLSLSYFESPAGKEGGGIHSRGLEEGWARLWERIPLPAGWSGLNEIHHRDGSICQELTRANNVACGGAGWEGNWG